MDPNEAYEDLVGGLDCGAEESLGAVFDAYDARDDVSGPGDGDATVMSWARAM
jgi:hypothetical protein